MYMFLSICFDDSSPDPSSSPASEGSGRVSASEVRSSSSVDACVVGAADWADPLGTVEGGGIKAGGGTAGDWFKPGGGGMGSEPSLAKVNPASLH